MRYMHKLFHEYTSKDFEDEYSKRNNYASTVHLNLFIKPIKQPNIYELYYVPAERMLHLVEDVYMVSQKLNVVFGELPGVAKKQFINECIADELYNTNELEGVKSSREEIVKSTKDILLNKNTYKRFESMITSYLGLLTGNYNLPKTALEVRKIYDDITRGEIENTELPDGEIFRKEITHILKKSGTGKVIHLGVTPESEIISLLEKLLQFMNGAKVPNIIKAAIGHYYFGYIHPFYDGNGRTSRFISSMYLAKTLGNIPALSLSRGCNKYRDNYLEAFEYTNSIRSRGEMNGFIEVFLEIILETLVQMEVELKEKSQLLDMASKKLENEPKLQHRDESYKEIMFILAQNHFFDSVRGFTINDLAVALDKSQATIRKLIKDLLALSLIEQKGERPAYYYIRERYFEE